jgi:hypothetical protein
MYVTHADRKLHNAVVIHVSIFFLFAKNRALEAAMVLVSFLLSQMYSESVDNLSPQSIM